MADARPAVDRVDVCEALTGGQGMKGLLGSHSGD